MNDINPLKVDDLSARTIKRAMEAPDTFRPYPWSNDMPTNKTLHAAVHFNDPGKCALNVVATMTGVTLFCYFVLKSEKLEVDSKTNQKISRKNYQMGDLFAIVCHKLRDVVHGAKDIGLVRELTIPASVYGTNITINLKEVVEGTKGQGVFIKFGENEEDFASDGIFDQTLRKFEADIFHKLSVHANSFLQKTISPDTKTPNTLCQHDAGFPFVSVNTYHDEANNRAASVDCAIVVKQDDMLAATVVHGCGPSPISSVSRQYCALITAAALDTVKHAVLGNGLHGKDLQRYFFETVKLLDQDSNFVEVTATSSREVAFGGVVLFFDREGNKQRFVYGLGNVAVAAHLTSNLTLTHHLHGDVVVANDYVDYTKNYVVPTLGVKPQDNFNAKVHVTAQVSDVKDVIESIQIMTGCDQAFYDFNSEKKGSNGGPNTILCQHLPAHGEFVEPDRFNNRSDDALHLSINVPGVMDNMLGWPDSFEFK